MDAYTIFPILAIIIMIVLFFVLRSLVLWYWRIDKAIALLELQASQQKEIIHLLQQISALPSAPLSGQSQNPVQQRSFPPPPH
ncbi:MAG: hypothetical protein ACRETN_08305 [Nevskiales bacterium]